MGTQTNRLSGLILRGLASLACLVGAGGAWSQAANCLASTTPVNSVEMRLLLISADGHEAVLPAIRNTLDYSGIPYDLLLAKDIALTADVLCQANDGYGHARYQGVLLATSGLGFELTPGNFVSAFTSEEWNLLWQYEAKYGVRQATLYTYPGGWPDTFGLSAPTAGIDTTKSPIYTSLTASSPASSGNPAGTQVFSYLKASAPIVIRNAYTYLAQPASGAAVTPLLVDGAGNFIASINNYADGRKNLAVTADGNPSLLHTLALGYGIVNWVTKGVYVGQRRVYLSAQPDDVMIPDDIWDPAANSDATGKTYRLTGDDYNKFAAWQTNRNATKSGSIVIEIPFNAVGTTSVLSPAELFPATTDTLTPAIFANNAPFDWISHTYTHLNLDTATYTATLNELRQNDKAAKAKNLLLRSYWKDGLITPDISGLTNSEALRAMSDFGVRYIVSNTSLNCNSPAGCPGPNKGAYNPLQKNILMVPRYPANLFYNVCTPLEWTSEYNSIYQTFWGKKLTYEEVLDKESDIWLRYMLNFDMRPVMFHQSNMCAYDGGSRSLLGDLIDATIDKYSALYTLPPRSRQLRQIGSLMQERMKLDDALAPVSGAALTARILPGATASTIVVTNPTATPVTVPVTGVKWTGATSRETYGGQTTSKVSVSANGGAVTITGAPAW